MGMEKRCAKRRARGGDRSHSYLQIRDTQSTAFVFGYFWPLIAYPDCVGCSVRFYFRCGYV